VPEQKAEGGGGGGATTVKVEGTALGEDDN